MERGKQIYAFDIIFLLFSKSAVKPKDRGGRLFWKMLLVIHKKTME